MTVDGQYYEVARPGSLSERFMIKARDHIYADFLKTCAPKPNETILDVGVSDVLNDGANVLERLYPHRRQITACGLGEAKEFQSAKIAHAVDKDALVSAIRSRVSIVGFLSSRSTKLIIACDKRLACQPPAWKGHVPRASPAICGRRVSKHFGGACRQAQFEHYQKRG